MVEGIRWGCAEWLALHPRTARELIAAFEPDVIVALPTCSRPRWFGSSTTQPQWLQLATVVIFLEYARKRGLQSAIEVMRHVISAFAVTPQSPDFLSRHDPDHVHDNHIQHESDCNRSALPHIAMFILTHVYTMTNYRCLRSLRLCCLRGLQGVSGQCCPRPRPFSSKRRSKSPRLVERVCYRGSDSRF